MSIQSNINQVMSLAGALASQSPVIRAKGEQAARLRELKQTAENITKRDEIILQHLRHGSDTEAQEAAKASEPLEKEAIATSEKIFTAIPTEEKYQKLAGNIKVAEERQAFREESATKLKEEVERARKSREFAELITSGVYSSVNDPRKKGEV